MAKIPYLHGQPRADGRVAWHWKPSPRLRKMGWTNHFLGDGPPPAGRSRKPAPPESVLQAALRLNERLAEYEQGGADAAHGGAQPKAPRKWTFADLVDAYKQSDAYRVDIAAATRREYDSRLRQLAFWAQGGALPVRAIDEALVADLKRGLLAPGADGQPGSKFKCAAMLRVLRLLMRWGKGEGILATDPTANVTIPSPPSRRSLLAWRDLVDIAALPGADPLGALALRIGFWSMLRREDLRLLSRFQWRELHGADPRDLPALVDDRGRVMGFRVQPIKTRNSSGAWVDCPMPPFLHAEIEAAFGLRPQAAEGGRPQEGSQFLFPHSLDAAQPVSGDVMRRRVKPLLVAGGFEGHQLRDMRRSGMSWVCDMGAEKADVFAISGHPLDGQQRTMADVYMPPNTRKACRAIAAACRTLAAVEAREKEQG